VLRAHRRRDASFDVTPPPQSQRAPTSWPHQCFRVVAGFIDTYLGAVLRPRRTFDALVGDPRCLKMGAAAVAVTAVNYTLVYVFLAHNGGRPTTFAPWLAIDPEVYYRYNQWLLAPSLALAWISAAGFAHLAARGLGGRGSFEGTLAAMGFALSVASWWTGVHDVVTSGLGFFGVIDQRAYEDAMNQPTIARAVLLSLMTMYALWFFLLFGKAIAAAHRLGAAGSAGCGAIGVVVYHLVFLTFNR
jgi:hypothetical protein